MQILVAPKTCLRLLHVVRYFRGVRGDCKDLCLQLSSRRGVEGGKFSPTSSVGFLTEIWFFSALGFLCGGLLRALSGEVGRFHTCYSAENCWAVLRMFACTYIYPSPEPRATALACVRASFVPFSNFRRVPPSLVLAADGTASGARDFIFLAEAFGLGIGSGAWRRVARRAGSRLRGKIPLL